MVPPPDCDCHTPAVSDELLRVVCVVSIAPPSVTVPGLLGSMLLNVVCGAVISAPLNSAELPTLIVIALSDINLLPRAVVCAWLLLLLLLSMLMPTKLVRLSLLLVLLLWSTAA